MYWTREIVARKRISFAEQAALLDEVFARYQVARVCQLVTGMGEMPVEDAQRRHGSTRVEGVLFTGPNKLTLATRGKEAFEDRRIRIPAGFGAAHRSAQAAQGVGPHGCPALCGRERQRGPRGPHLGVFFGGECHPQRACPYRVHERRPARQQPAAGRFHFCGAASPAPRAALCPPRLRAPN